MRGYDREPERRVHLHVVDVDQVAVVARVHTAQEKKEAHCTGFMWTQIHAYVRFGPSQLSCLGTCSSAGRALCLEFEVWSV